VIPGPISVFNAPVASAIEFWVSRRSDHERMHAQSIERVESIAKARGKLDQT
jgi:hypothetical protein